MGTAVPGLIVVLAILGTVDFLSNLKNLGDSVARNAVIKNVLAFVGAFGILLLAAHTTIAGGFSLHGIIPSVASEATLKTLSAADVAFAALLFAFNAASVATFRKAFDGSQSAAQPSLTNQ